MTKLTHTDEKGRANMVDVKDKGDMLRVAKASGNILLQPATIGLIKQNQMKKGDVLTVAQIAGIQAAKVTPNLIPLCHTLLLTKVDVKLSLTQTGVLVESEVHCIGKTGVEMEALTAVSTALLTVYDMCKAVDKTMVISTISLISKTKNTI